MLINVRCPLLWNNKTKLAVSQKWEELIYAPPLFTFQLRLRQSSNIKKLLNAVFVGSVLRLEACVDPAQAEGAAGVLEVSVQDDVWFVGVAVAVVETEVSAL